MKLGTATKRFSGQWVSIVLNESFLLQVPFILIFITVIIDTKSCKTLIWFRNSHWFNFKRISMLVISLAANQVWTPMLDSSKQLLYLICHLLCRTGTYRLQWVNLFCYKAAFQKISSPSKNIPLVNHLYF